MSARADKRPAGDANDADAVRRRQLLLFSVIAAVVLVAVAAWLGMGGGKTDAPQGGIDAGIVGPDAAEMVWTRRSEARLNKVENALRRMEQEARRLRTENEGLRTKLAADTTNALRTIDAHKAAIDDLERRLQPAGPGAAQGTAPAGDPWFRGQAATPPGGAGQQPAGPVRTRMIETFELDGTPQSSARDPRNGAELVADAAAKPVSAWLPAGAHAEAVVLAGVDASAGGFLAGRSASGAVAHHPDRPGPPPRTAPPCRSMSTAAPSRARPMATLSSEKVYVRFRTMTCAGPEPGTVIETEVAGFVAGSGKTGVRGPVVSREGALVEKAFLAGMISGVGQGVAQAFQPQAVAAGTRRDRRPTARCPTSAGPASAPGRRAPGRRSPTT